MITFQRKLTTKIRLLLSLVSALMFALPWMGGGGFPLVVALVPLLIISAEYSDSVRDAWRMAGWGVLTFVIWNALTVWWVWNATPIGPIAATIFSTWWSLVPLMLFHIASKRVPKVVAYILFIAAWIGCEYIYTQAPALSFPWLTLGNGFAYDVWAVQWYEYTGAFGGSLWVLVVNVLALESLLTMSKRVWVEATLALFLPMALSLGLYLYNSPEGAAYTERRSVEVAVVQPNVDCYEKFAGDTSWQQRNLLDLLGEVPVTAEFVLMPETSLPTLLNERVVGNYSIVQEIAATMRERGQDALVVAGCQTVRQYGEHKGSTTARRQGSMYYDIYNAAVGIEPTATYTPLHRKGRLVIGVETLPAWLRGSTLFGVDLGGIAGQLGIGASTLPFEYHDVKVAPAICYEGLYGAYMGEFVRNGAQALFVVSNDGWWGDTPGYRYLFAYCRLRAIEHRRDVARSANTGISGFITSRGDDIATLGWDERGVVTERIRLNDKQTLYTRYGDYLGRLSLYVALLCILYGVAYWSKRKFYLN
ncbi:MAG: apolipoprotein N-acyltransferase [Alistipes sp.]|nr:apolipoprotein N-acyltransferase [Alistipes sp.]